MLNTQSKKGNYTLSWSKKEYNTFEKFKKTIIKFSGYVVELLSLKDRKAVHQFICKYYTRNNSIRLSINKQNPKIQIKGSYSDWKDNKILVIEPVPCLYDINDNLLPPEWNENKTNRDDIYYFYEFINSVITNIVISNGDMIIKLIN